MPNPFLSLLLTVVAGVLGWALIRPGRGLIARWRQSQRQSQRVHTEDALKHIHKREMKGRAPSVESIAGALHLNMDATARLLGQMEADRLLRIEAGEIRLTPQGRDAALHIIRAHRLWERYLAEQTGYDETEWHRHAERREHDLTPAGVEALAARLGHPTHDPHGDPIPTATGDLVTHGGNPLTTFPVDTAGIIVHVEDEPDIIYAQLVAEGLHPGMPVRVTESTSERVRFWANGDEHVLAPMLAGNVSVAPVTTPVDEETTPTGCERLSCLEMDQTAEVVSLSRACRGAERRRFMDLGILPGTTITAEMRSPGGDPTAYKIRGALIALRKEQADLINVKRTDQLSTDDLSNGE